MGLLCCRQILYQLSYQESPGTPYTFTVQMGKQRLEGGSVPKVTETQL